jgi:hypothetical protein
MTKRGTIDQKANLDYSMVNTAIKQQKDKEFLKKAKNIFMNHEEHAQQTSSNFNNRRNSKTGMVNMTVRKMSACQEEPKFLKR